MDALQAYLFGQLHGRLAHDFEALVSAEPCTVAEMRAAHGQLVQVGTLV